MGLFDDWGLQDSSLGGAVLDEQINWDQTPEEAAEQEFLGRSVLEGSQQEELGRGIVQESIGRNLIDDFISGSNQVEPWLRSLDGTLGSAARSITQVDRLLGRTQQIVAPGGVPREIAQRDRVSPVLDSVRRYIRVNPPTANATLFSPRPASTLTAQFGMEDYVTLGLVAVGAFVLWKALR